MSGARSSRPAWAGAVEWTVVLAFAALWIALARGLARAADGPVLWLLPLVAAAGILAADFASGFVHWFCDSVFEEETPLVGPLVILPFREHHRDPLAMTHHAFMEITGNICLALAPALLLGLWLLPAPRPGAPAIQLAHALLLAATTAAFWTNQLHKWAHTPRPPRAVAWLQRRRIILAPAAHGRHHRPAGRAYCVLTGWMNAPLDRIDFFPRLERLMAAAGFRWFTRAEWPGTLPLGETER
jgi:hypothetical protein